MATIIIANLSLIPEKISTLRGALELAELCLLRLLLALMACPRNNVIFNFLLIIFGF